MTIEISDADVSGTEVDHYPRDEHGQTTVDDLILDADSETSPVISVVLPTLNEEQGIQECISQIKTVVSTIGAPTEIIVADSSTDRTPEIARSLGAIVIEPDKRGYGQAYRSGFEQVRGRYVVMGDADTTYDFTAMPKLLEPVMHGEADMCLGSRLEGTIKPGAMPPLHRYVGNPLLTKFLNTFYNAGVSDAHSGFRVVTRDALEQLELQSDGMEFASEMVMDASARGLHIEEVPITYHERRGEETLDSFRDGWRHVKFMLVNAPGYLFSVPGLLLTVIGAMIMLGSVLSLSVAGIAFQLQTMIGGSMLTIVGHQVVSFGVFSSVAADPIREPQDRLTNRLRRHFQLEYGLGLGLLVSIAGGLGMAYLSVIGLLEGGVSLPSATWTLLASTAVVLGVLTIFSSFFMSILLSEQGA